MQNTLIQPRNQEEFQLVTQLMERMKIKSVVAEETPKQKKKREILDGLERSVEEMNAYLRSKIQMKSADDFLSEL